MSKETVKESYISSIYSVFFENALVQIDRARHIYNKNYTEIRTSKGFRQLIAPMENEASALAITQLAIGLESFLNSQAFYRNQKDFNTYSQISKKIGKIIEKPYPLLEKLLVELSVVRDSLAHGHLWIKTRERDKNDFSIKSIRSYLWKPFKAKLQPKYLDSVNGSIKRTRIAKLAVIPVDVGFLDAVQALLIVSKTVQLCLDDKGNGWKPLFYPYKQVGFYLETIKVMRNNPKIDQDLCGWEKYFRDYLHEPDASAYRKFLTSLETEVG